MEQPRQLLNRIAKNLKKKVFSTGSSSSSSSVEVPVSKQKEIIICDEIHIDDDEDEYEDCYDVLFPEEITETNNKGKEVDKSEVHGTSNSSAASSSGNINGVHSSNSFAPGSPKTVGTIKGSSSSVMKSASARGSSPAGKLSWLRQISESQQSNPGSSQHHQPAQDFQNRPKVKLPNVCKKPTYASGSKLKVVASSGSVQNDGLNPLDAVNFTSDGQPFRGNSIPFPIQPGLHDPVFPGHTTPKMGPMQWFQNIIKSRKKINISPKSGAKTIKSAPNILKVTELDNILRRFELFKKFDIVEDCLDHNFFLKKTSASKDWAKNIQNEWKILKSHLPDMIFVRAYESRMDLLRAVIIGVDGTPYHDGLFFFDVFFPSDYPNNPPKVHYHSRGLRINPNLYNCGKVCISLLNTWTGNLGEKWIPGKSNMLQVLISIQGLILNAKPYFNEPGRERFYGTVNGELQSQNYNENTFTLSLKTMSYTIRRPPKHFEDFVVGHFHKRAHDILAACKAYKEGTKIGSFVKGSTQASNQKTVSANFTYTLVECINMLVKDFTSIGVKDCKAFAIKKQQG